MVSSRENYGAGNAQLPWTQMTLWELVTSLIIRFLWSQYTFHYCRETTLACYIVAFPLEKEVISPSKFSAEISNIPHRVRACRAGGYHDSRASTNAVCTLDRTLFAKRETMLVIDALYHVDSFVFRGRWWIKTAHWGHRRSIEVSEPSRDGISHRTDELHCSCYREQPLVAGGYHRRLNQWAPWNHVSACHILLTIGRLDLLVCSQTAKIKVNFHDAQRKNDIILCSHHNAALLKSRPSQKTNREP